MHGCYGQRLPVQALSCLLSKARGINALACLLACLLACCCATFSRVLRFSFHRAQNSSGWGHGFFFIKRKPIQTLACCSPTPFPACFVPQRQKQQWVGARLFKKTTTRTNPFLLAVESARHKNPCSLACLLACLLLFNVLPRPALFVPQIPK